MTTPGPSHIDPLASDLAFASFPELDGTYGSKIKVSESSTASGPHIWIKATDESGKAVVLHLTTDTAWKFAEQIITAVQNHYQGDATPASAEYQVTRSIGVRNGAGCPCQACTKEA